MASLIVKPVPPALAVVDDEQRPLRHAPSLARPAVAPTKVEQEVVGRRRTKLASGRPLGIGLVLTVARDVDDLFERELLGTCSLREAVAL
jgi:hypothetical protein